MSHKFCNCGRCLKHRRLMILGLPVLCGLLLTGTLVFVPSLSELTTRVLHVCAFVVWMAVGFLTADLLNWWWG